MDHGLKSKSSKLLGILKLLAIFSNISAGSAWLKDIMLQYISQNCNTARSKTKIIDLTGQRQEAVKSLKPRKSRVNNLLINFKRPSDLQLTFLCVCVIFACLLLLQLLPVRVSLPFMRYWTICRVIIDVSMIKSFPCF